MHTHIVNFFEITNTPALVASYRLVEVDGPFDPRLGDGDVADRNLHQLVKRIQYEERIPVAIETSGSRPRLAIPANHELSRTSYDLTPDVATLRALNEVHSLRVAENKDRIALAFLSWYLRTPLYRHELLWSTGSSTYFNKRPLNYRIDNREIDVYRGFGFRVGHVDGRIGVWVRLTHRYAESRWLLDSYDDSEILSLRMRHFLYHYGNTWFTIQLLGLAGKSIRDQTFIPNGNGAAISVYDYTAREVGGHRAPAWIQSLDSASPAISYRYPGNEKRRLGAAALCKLLVPTEDPRVRGVHRQSLVDPHSRFVDHRHIVETYLQKAHFGETPICIRPTARQVEPKIFSVPAQEFGQGKILRIGSKSRAGEATLNDYAKRRFDYLLDSEGGFAVNTALDAQCILIPASLERKIAEDFQDRLENTVRSLTNRPYSLTRLVYDDKNARTLKRQVDAITTALDRANVRSGKGLLMLPANAQPDLHNFLKRKLSNAFEFQCVCAKNVDAFYEMQPDSGRATYFVPQRLASRYVSYLRYTAMGLMLVNKQWPWVLADGTKYDAYVAVDVLHNMAAFTFFGDGGRQCFVRTVQSEQSERLLRKQVRTVIYEHLCTSLSASAKAPRSIVLRRDGRAFRTEWEGFRDAIEQLKRERRLAADVVYGIVEVHKSTAEGIRMVEELQDGLANPQIGAWSELSATEGIVCTTGFPFSLQGTANPVFLKIVAGDLQLDWLLQDFFDMSQLCWSKPDGFIRLSIDLKLCDEQLRALASTADDDEAQFGVDDVDSTDESERQAAGWHN